MGNRSKRKRIRLFVGVGVLATAITLGADAAHLLRSVELTSIDKLDEAYERVVKGDVKYRFVIDMATLKK